MLSRNYCIGKVLIEARLNGEDPFSAIESIISWDEFTQSITEAEQLSRPESFDFIEFVKNSYSQIRRYSPALLEVLRFKEAPVAKDIVLGIEKLKELMLLISESFRPICQLASCVNAGKHLNLMKME